VGQGNWVVVYLYAKALSVGQASNIWVVDFFFDLGFVKEVSLQLRVVYMVN
jgi:hypothetical protein